MAKGGAYERRISVLLSEWWSFGRRSDIFWRSDSSGARATQRAKRGRKTANSYGDICAIDPVGAPLLKVASIECKDGYSSKSVADLFDRYPTAASQQWETWILKAEQDAEASGALGWFLITHRKRRNEMIAMPRRLFVALDNSRMGKTGLAHELMPLVEFTVLLRSPGDVQPHRVVLTDLECFLDNVNPKDIRQLLISSPPE